MPRTLYRYILKDILKLLLLSTTVLVVVLSFAVAIKPLSEGLLDLGGLFKFVAATAPTMLYYALPFSAAFAVTLTFSRLASDSEIVACSASGLSYRAILAPVAALGAVLMVFLFVASNWVLPVFTRVALDMVQKDLMRGLVNQLQQGESVTMSDYKIYANQADEAPPPHIEGSEVQPDQLILLRGVAVGRIDPKTQKTRSDHTAEEADILVFRDGGRTWVQFRLKNALYHDEVTGDPFLESTAIGAESAEMLPNLELRSRFHDKPRAMTFGELQALLVDPEQLPRIVAEKQKLIAAIADEELLRRMLEGLQRSAASYGTEEAMGVRLQGARADQHYVVSAAHARREGNTVILRGTPRRPAMIDTYDQDRLARRYEARGEVRLELATLHAGGEPRIGPLLQDASVIDPRRPDRTTERSELKLSRLGWPQRIVDPLEEQSIEQLVALAMRDYADAAPVAKAADDLSTQLQRVHTSVVSEGHERAATALGCMLAALLGAVLSIYLRGRLPLVVYFWTFLGVFAGTLILQTGARMATDTAGKLAAGLIILWLSVAALAGGLAWLYFRMARN